VTAPATCNALLRAALVLVGLCAATPALAQQDTRHGDRIGARIGARIGTGEPSEVIAAEIAMARTARDKGDAAALKAYAAPDAQMRDAGASAFLPAATHIPPALGARSAKLVWISCDGSLGLTSAPLPNTQRFYATLWQRQRKGTPYRFVLDLVTTTATHTTDPDFTEAHVAPCPAAPQKVDQHPPAAFTLQTSDQLAGAAQDQSLSWSAKPAEGMTVILQLMTAAGQSVFIAADPVSPSFDKPSSPLPPAPQAKP